MLNIKKLFTKIVTQFASTVTGPETVSFPFTATKSGVCCVVVVPLKGILTPCRKAVGVC